MLWVVDVSLSWQDVVFAVTVAVAVVGVLFSGVLYYENQRLRTAYAALSADYNFAVEGYAWLVAASTYDVWAYVAYVHGDCGRALDFSSRGRESLHNYNVWVEGRRDLVCRDMVHPVYKDVYSVVFPGALEEYVCSSFVDVSYSDFDWIDAHCS